MSSVQTRQMLQLSRIWKTLAFRLTAIYAMAGMLLVFIATASLYLLLVTELEKSTSLFLQDKVHVISTLLRERPEDEDALREEVELESAARQYEHFYIRLLDQQNRSLLSTPGMAQALDLSKLEAGTAGHHNSAVPMTGTNGVAFRVTTAIAPVGESAARTVTLQIAIDVSQKEQFLARFRLWASVLLVVMLAIFPFVGYEIARQGIRPVEEMAATARRITSSHLGERIVAEGYPSELESLARTFNKMLDGLEDSFERISRFSADIAHDLRTPVNNIRGEAEVALARARTIDEYRDALGSSLEEAVRLSDLISNRLFLARTESPLTHLKLERVNVSDLLAGIRDYYEASAADSGIQITNVSSEKPVVAELDRAMIQRAVGNLVSNAVAHTPRGGSVLLLSSADPACVRIEVADTGVGIPPDALSRVFDRFFRVDPSRSQALGGTGLGLSIVQGIMTLHGGKVEIDSKFGQGTRVTLRMPISPTR
jgi:two-component system heavy metal sensor histidine kinase CusS